VTSVNVSAGTREHRDFDPFGDGTASGTLGGYAALRRHHQSDLELATYRAYDPKLGRWLSEDPLGFVDGLNMYAYVSNNPVRRIDPEGLYCKEIASIPMPAQKRGARRVYTSDWYVFKTNERRGKNPERSEGTAGPPGSGFRKESGAGRSARGRGSAAMAAVTNILYCWWRRDYKDITDWMRETMVVSYCIGTCQKVSIHTFYSRSFWQTSEDGYDRWDTSRQILPLMKGSCSDYPPRK
jgi:RHS repeat-associated protein